MPDKTYLSCPWIEGGLSLHHNALKFCCQPHGKNKGMPHIREYHGGPLPVEDIREARAALLEDIRAGRENPCAGCRFLEEKEWPDTEGRFDNITVNNSTACNLKCEYCYTVVEKEWNLEGKGYEVLPVFRDMIGRGLLSPEARVSFGGGEPTINPEFETLLPELIEHVKSVRVFTNAVRFSEAVEKGLATGKVEVETSVDAGTRELYQAIKGKDALETVWENLTRYAATGGPVCAKYILKANNSAPEELDAFLERCKRAKVSSIHATPEFYELSRGEVSSESLRGAARIIYEARRSNIDVNRGAESFGPYAPTVRMLTSQLFTLGDFLDDLAALWEKGEREEVLKRVFGPRSFVSFLDAEVYRLEKDTFEVQKALGYYGKKLEEKLLEREKDTFEIQKSLTYFGDKFEERLSDFEKITSYLGDRFEERMAAFDGRFEERVAALNEKLFKQEKDSVSFHEAFSSLYEKYERQIAEIMARNEDLDNRCAKLAKEFNENSLREDLNRALSEITSGLAEIRRLHADQDVRFSALDDSMRTSLSEISGRLADQERRLASIENCAAMRFYRLLFDNRFGAAMRRLLLGRKDA